MSVKKLPAYQLNLIMRQFRMKRLPRCQQKVMSVGFRGRNVIYGDRCGNVAKLEVDGKDLCIVHAKQYALHKMLKGVK